MNACRARVTPIDTLFRWFVIAVSMLMALAVAGCATGPKLVSHAFGFNTPQDSPQYEVLAYKYGEGKVVTTSSDSAIRLFGASRQGTNVNGPMPLGDVLYVKWRDKTSGKTHEDKVNLRALLPNDMTRQRIHFVVDDAQLFVYLIDPVPRPTDWPVVGPKKFRDEKVRQIYPVGVAGSTKKWLPTGARRQTDRQQNAAIAGTASRVIQREKFVFFAVFDDTSDIKDNPAFPGDPQRTPVGQAFERYDSSRPGGYYLANPLSKSTQHGSAATKEVRTMAYEAYDDFVRDAREWLAEDPSRSPSDISLSNGGSSGRAPMTHGLPAAGGARSDRR